MKKRTLIPVIAAVTAAAALSGWRRAIFSDRGCKSFPDGNIRLRYRCSWPGDCREN